MMAHIPGSKLLRKKDKNKTKLSTLTLWIKLQSAKHAYPLSCPFKHFASSCADFICKKKK